jgi:hypothetical protein
LIRSIPKKKKKITPLGEELHRTRTRKSNLSKCHRVLRLEKSLSGEKGEAEKQLALSLLIALSTQCLFFAGETGDIGV